LPAEFSSEKEALLRRLLDIDSVFTGGFSVGCEAMDGLALIADAVRAEDGITPRPLLENLERLAIAIHELYNERQRERYPDKPLRYPRFADLPDSLKYSNLRQAMGFRRNCG
jgi:hypothetical protein